MRAQFPLRSDSAAFSAYVLASHPAPVAEAIARHRAGLDEDTHAYLGETETDAETAVRDTAAEYLGAAPTEVALTDSTTMGLGLLYAGVRVPAGREVLTTEHDFYSTHQAWALRAARDGVVVRRARLYDDPAAATADDMVGRLMAQVTPATRVVAVTWVHSGTGVRLPVRAIADALAAANAGRGPDERALLCVDGVHGLGAVDAGVRDLGCDFLVAGTHKWLFGPRGTGIVWGRADAWGQVDPAIPAFEPNSFGEWRNGLPPAPTDGLRFTPGGYHTFEHRWALAEAFRFHLDIGRDRVAARTTEQATAIKAGLAEIPACAPGDAHRRGPVGRDRLLRHRGNRARRGRRSAGGGRVRHLGHPLRRGARAGGPEHRHHPRRGRRPPRGAAGLSVSPRSRGRRPGGPRTRAGAGRSPPTRG